MDNREYLDLSVHEIKNILSAISGYSEFISNKMVDSDKVLEFAEKIRKLSDILAGYMDRKYKYEMMHAGLYQTLFEPISVLEKLESAKKSLTESGLGEMEFQISCSPEIKIYADSRLTEELFAELMENAVKYSLKNFAEISVWKSEDGFAKISVQKEEKGFAEISVRKLEEDFTGILVPKRKEDFAEILVQKPEEESAKNFGQESGKEFTEAFVPKPEENVVISIRNRSEEIMEDELSRLTEPYFRIDKAASRKMGGQGFGLAIAYEIMKLHDGEINITYENGYLMVELYFHNNVRMYA